MADESIVDLIAEVGAWRDTTPAGWTIRRQRLVIALRAATEVIEQFKQYHDEVLEELKDAEREVSELRDAARRLVAAWPNDDAGFDSALAELAALAGS